MTAIRIIRRLLEYIDSSQKFAKLRLKLAKKIAEHCDIETYEDVNQLLSEMKTLVKKHKHKVAEKLATVLSKDDALMHLIETSNSRKIQLCSGKLCEKLTKAYIAYLAFKQLSEQKNPKIFKTFRKYAYYTELQK